MIIEVQNVSHIIP